MQKLEDVVEYRGVAVTLDDNRKDFVQIIVQQIRFAECLSRAHPINVPAQRVDFAVM